MCANISKIISRCGTCGAVEEQIGTERVWTKSIGIVIAAASMDVPMKKCCGCIGHPENFGGFPSESHLGEILAV